MSKVKLVINKAGMDEFLNSEDVCDMLTEAASGVLARLGDGYELQAPYHGPHRANVAIATNTEKTYWDQIKNNTMLKACGGKK